MYKRQLLARVMKRDTRMLTIPSVRPAPMTSAGTRKARASITCQLARVKELLSPMGMGGVMAVSYTHLRAHETVLDLVCRLLLEKKKKTTK